MDASVFARPAERETRFNQRAIECVLWGALLFNWLLAALNANALAVSSAMVAACELLLLCAALALAARAGLRREQLYLLCGFGIYLAFTLLRFMLAQAVEAKPVRDMAIVFTFICLGMAYRRQPAALVYRMTLALLAIGCVEIFLADNYLRVFNIKSYYINTRGFSEADFWNADSDLFVSGTRPGERFFLAFTHWPRASSVFLEPVSLGNFIVVSLTVLLASWRHIPRLRLLAWAGALAALLVISDSRYAFACGLVLIGLSVALRRFPQQLSFVLFIGVVIAGAVLVRWSGVMRASDDFLGRVFYTFNALQGLTPDMLMGVRFDLASRYMDSGLGYFIVAQSLPVVIALMLYCSIGIVGGSSDSRFYKNALMIAWSLSLLISNSLFSIKVGALMWFALGAFAAAHREARLREPFIFHIAPSSPRRLV